MSIAAARRAGRTRLTHERELELYDAVIDLLREVGYEALTMDAVAARTHSSKATLYRQWKGKPELVTAALGERKPLALDGIDTGTLTGDLREAARLLGGRGDQDIAVIRALSHAVEKDPDLARAFRESFVQPGLQALQHMLDRAVSRGEVDPKRAARAFLPHLIVGALLTRPLLENRFADRAYLRRYVDAVVLPALGLSR